MDIQLIQYFVEVVRHGSFTQAADSLKIPNSTLSKAVAKLEKETGTKLLIRSTRRQSLTATGRIFYGKCIGPIQNLSDAQKEIYGKDNIVAGDVKISVPEDLEIFLFSETIYRLCTTYPALNIMINSTNQVVDLVGEGYDFAIRLGPLKTSNLIVRKVGQIDIAVVASKKYASQINLKNPSDLQTVRCLGISTNRNPQTWTLMKKNKSESAKIKLRIESNHIASILKLTLLGAGVTALPRFLCQKSIDSGDLIEVLNGWKMPDYPVSLVSPESGRDSARLKAISSEFINVLKKALT